MLPGPVFNVELLTTARRARYYGLRVVYGLILLFFVWRSDPSFSPWQYPPNRGRSVSIAQMAALGRSLFLTFMLIQSITVLLVTPALIAGVIAEEKQRKTLHYLLASQLSSSEIVLGKLAARLLHLGVFVALGLPIACLISLFGGVDPNLILGAYAATLTTGFFLASLSILVSVVTRRPREAISLAYLLELAWLFVPGFTSFLLPMGGPTALAIYEWIKPVNDWLVSSSPFGVLMVNLGPMRFGSSRAVVEAVAWMMGLQVAAGSVFLALAVARLRPVFRNEGAEGGFLARLGGRKHGRRFLPRPACDDDDPMLWKERYVSRTSAGTKAIVITLVVLVTGLLVYTSLDFTVPAVRELAEFGYGGSGTHVARDSLNRYVRALCTVLYLVLALGVASTAAGGLTHEREEDTWISLIATPLDGVEILRAKMIGAVWGFRWLVGMLVAFWALGLVAGAVHPFGFAAVAIETSVFVWFAAALGTYFSLRSRSSARALVATIGVLILLNGGYLMCCIGMRADTIIVGAGVTPMIEGISLATYQEIDHALGLADSSSYGYRRQAETIAACVLSVLLYAAAAFGLTVAAFGRFDRDADRPRRDWSLPFPPPLFAAKSEPPDEIDGEPE